MPDKQSSTCKSHVETVVHHSAVVMLLQFRSWINNEYWATQLELCGNCVSALISFNIITYANIVNRILLDFYVNQAALQIDWTFISNVSTSVKARSFWMDAWLPFEQADKRKAAWLMNRAKFALMRLCDPSSSYPSLRWPRVTSADLYRCCLHQSPKNQSAAVTLDSPEGDEKSRGGEAHNYVCTLAYICMITLSALCHSLTAVGYGRQLSRNQTQLVLVVLHSAVIWPSAACSKRRKWMKTNKCNMCAWHWFTFTKCALVLAH